MHNNKIAVILTVFDHEYKFQDNLLIGIADNPLEASGLLMNDIFRVLSDFGYSNGEITINECSNYEHDLTIVTTGKGDDQMHWHYYCLFSDKDDATEIEVGN